MLIEPEDLLFVDSRLQEEDERKYRETYNELVEFLYSKRQDEDFDKADIVKIPLYWSKIVLDGAKAMVSIYPETKFLFVRSVNYGIKIHHTTTTRVINQMNTAKLRIAKTIDEEICRRVDEFYTKENPTIGE